MQADMHGKLHAALEDGFFLFPFEQQQQPNIYYDTTTDQEDRPCFSFGSTISLEVGILKSLTKLPHLSCRTWFIHNQFI